MTAFITPCQCFHALREEPARGRGNTSQARPQAAFGEAAVTKWKEAGLLRPSVLKPVVATIERGLVMRKLGQLEEEDRAALRKVLGAILYSGA